MSRLTLSSLSGGLTRRLERRPAAMVAAVALLAVAQVGTLVVRSSPGGDAVVVTADGPDAPAVDVAAADAALAAPDTSLDDTVTDTAPAPTTPSAAAGAPSSTGNAGADAAPAREPAAGQVADRTAGRYPNDPARERFEQQFPAQARAGQDASRDPASTRWAVLVGVNEHIGRTRDNLGSRQDAEDLYAHLRYLGWQEDHIVLLRDGLATRENIIQAIAWLGRKTNENSVAIFSYSGHTKQWRGVDYDGDGEVPDEGLWPSDNDKIVDSYFVHRMTAVKAGRLWINIGACEAAGFMDRGLRRKGRLLTFSSEEPEKSYEDPSVGNSVWGWFMIDRGLRAGMGDRNGDGDTTVEEAFWWARPKAYQRTRQASHGPQTAVLVDDQGRGEFSLRIPPPPRRTGASSGGEDDDEDCLLGLCTRRDD